MVTTGNSAAHVAVEDPNELDAQAFEREAEAAHLRARAARLRSAARSSASPSVSPTGLLTSEQVARELNVSKATVRRASSEPGCPAVYVGASLRWDLQATRNWFASRGKRRATQKTAPDNDGIDIDSVVRAAGLRAVGGGR